MEGEKIEQHSLPNQKVKKIGTSCHGNSVKRRENSLCFWHRNIRPRIIDLKIENLDRVSIPAKSVATFEIRHPIHGTTYGVRPRSAFEAVSVHFSLCWAI